MATVYLNLGSNIEREARLCAGLDALQHRFGPARLSSVYESEAVGFVGDPFLNMAAGIETELPPEQLAADLRELEYRHGRDPASERFTSRSLDIDILTYDDRVGNFSGLELPRPEILYNAFVLWPLAELAPDARHPVARRSYRELWQSFDQHSQQLWPVDFYWAGKQISRAG